MNKYVLHREEEYSCWEELPGGWAPVCLGTGEEWRERMLPAFDNLRKAIYSAYSVQKPNVAVESLKCDEPELRYVIQRNPLEFNDMRTEGKILDVFILVTY